LTTEERERLNRLVRGGQHAARIVTRARILLKIDEGWNTTRVASALDVAEGMVYRVKRRSADEGLDGVLRDWVQDNRFRKFDEMRGTRQPEHSPNGLPVRDLSRRRGSAHRETLGVSPR